MPPDQGALWSRAKVDPRLAFFLGWLLGRRRRNRGGMGCLLLAAGLFIGMTALMSLVAAPLGWADARAAARLSRPAPHELATLAPGTSLLIAAQLPVDLPADEHGLALFYAEQAVANAGQVDGEAGASAASGDAVRQPPPSHVGMILADGAPVAVQIKPGAAFLAAQVVEPGPGTALRYVGYAPGQVLTVRGTAAGERRLLADSLYAGTPDEYLNYLDRLPGLGLLSGFVCGGVALLLVMAGAVLRLAGG